MKPRLKVQPYQPAPLNTQDFDILIECLFELHRKKYAACARTLGISTPTFRKWYDKLDRPTWPYWNLVIREVVVHMVADMQARRHSFTASEKTYIQEQLAQLSNKNSLIEKISFLTWELKGSEDHLHKLLLRGGMETKQIFKAANAGGYSRAALRYAARKIGVVEYTRGFGDNKSTRWRLPTVESMMDELEDD